MSMSAVLCAGQTAMAPDQQRQAAIAFEQQGNTSEAETAWRAFLKAHPSNAEPTPTLDCSKRGRSATRRLCRFTAEPWR